MSNTTLKNGSSMYAKPGYFELGDVIADRYVVERKLQGGMGVVFLCLDRTTGRIVALKTLKDEFFVIKRRKDLFVKEMETWIQLGKHPHVVQAFHIEDVYGIPFIAMEQVPPWSLSSHLSIGPSLKGYLSYFHSDGNRFDFSLVISWSLHICLGMKYAEEKFQSFSKPFAHLDLKPQNILVTPDYTAKITDFGLAKTDIEKRKVGGTLQYAAPEQFESLEVDVRADIYSFGLILYEMIAGRPFYSIIDKKNPSLQWEVTNRKQFEVDWQQTLYQILKRCTCPLSSENISRVVSIIEKCIEPEPNKRFQHFRDIISILSSVYEVYTGKLPGKITTEQETVRELINWGYSLNYLGHHEEAISKLNEVCSRGYENAQLWLNMGMSQYGLGKKVEAEEAFGRALELQPDYAYAWFNLGVLHYDRNEYHLAEQDYRNAIQSQPQFKEAHLNLGLLLKETGRSGEGIQCLEEAVRNAPRWTPALLELGRALQETGGNGIQWFEEAIRIDPRWSPAWLELGKALHMIGEIQQAVQSLQIAIMYDPKAVEAMICLSKIYEDQGDPERAKSMRHKAYTILHPSNDSRE